MFQRCTAKARPALTAQLGSSVSNDGGVLCAQVPGPDDKNTMETQNLTFIFHYAANVRPLLEEGGCKEIDIHTIK